MYKYSSRNRDPLVDFKSYPKSKSCYLDGRYFNKVFENYPGLLSNPLYIHIHKNEITSYMTNTLFNTEINLLRVVITSDTIRHSVLVIIDHQAETILIYDPDTYHPELHKIIVDNVTNYFDYDYNIIDDEIVITTKIPKYCKKSGLCNALVILYAYRYLMNEYVTNDDIIHIRNFMNAIEENYTLPPGTPDIEYLSDNNLLFIGGGALTGGAVGAAVGGPYGAIAGAGLGGLGGFLISNNIDRNNDRRYDRRYYL